MHVLFFSPSSPGTLCAIMIDSMVLRPWNEVASPRRPPAGLGYISTNGHFSMTMVGSREIISLPNVSGPGQEGQIGRLFEVKGVITW